MLFREKTGILTLDLAKGVPGATRDPINPLAAAAGCSDGNLGSGLSDGNLGSDFSDGNLRPDLGHKKDPRGPCGACLGMEFFKLV